MKNFREKADLKVFGQEINPESYAICRSDMLIKGQDTGRIKFGNTFTVDGLADEKFDYMLSIVALPDQLFYNTGRGKDIGCRKGGIKYVTKAHR